MATLYTIQNSINWAQFFLGTRPLALLGTLEPALTSASIITQTMLNAPFRWRWNRNYLSFQTVSPGVVWTPTISYALGYRIQDTNGNMQTVTTSGISGGSLPAWSTTYGGTTTDGGVTWTMSYISDYVQTVAGAGIGHVEEAFVQSSTGIWAIPNVQLNGGIDLGSGRANTIIPYFENASTNAMTFRFMPGIPDTTYTVTVVYQNKPVTLTGLTSVWQMPAEYGNVYNWGFLAMMALFAGVEDRFQLANQKFTSSLLSVSEGLDEQEKWLFLQQWDPYMAMQARSSMKVQAGAQGRGV